MEIVVYIISGVCGVLAIYAVVKAGLFKRKKKSNAKPQEKPKDAGAEIQKPAADTGFKVTKKERLTRVSKKALQTDSRTATVERVFAKTKEDENADGGEIQISQKLSREDEDLISAIEQINTEERKVVSLDELKKQSEVNKAVDLAQEKLEAEGIKTIDGENKKRTSSGRAGEVTGEYSGISIGRKGTSFSPKKTDATQKVEKKDDDDDELDFDNLFKNRSPFMDPEFNPFRNRNRFFGHPEPVEKEKPKKFDLGDAVQAEAILNPKFKNKNKK